MDNEDISKGNSKHWKGKAIKLNPKDFIEKVEYDVRFIIRAMPDDYQRIKDEIEEILKKYD